MVFEVVSEHCVRYSEAFSSLYGVDDWYGYPSGKKKKK